MSNSWQPENVGDVVKTVFTLGFYSMFKEYQRVSGNPNQVRFSGDAITAIEETIRQLADGTVETVRRSFYKRMVELAGPKGQVTADHVREAAKALMDKQ